MERRTTSCRKQSCTESGKPKQDVRTHVWLGLEAAAGDGPVVEGVLTALDPVGEVHRGQTHEVAAVEDTAEVEVPATAAVEDPPAVVA